MTLRDHLGPRTEMTVAESDDRVRPMLLEQASKRGALDWRYDDVEPVVARLLQEIDTLRAALEAAPAAVLMEARHRVNETIAERQADLHGARNSFNKGAVDALQEVQARIRALATPDSTAALKRVIEKAGRVKALEWKDCDATAVSEIYAETAFGLYMIDRCIGGSFLLTHCDIGIGMYTTIEAAKTAAQGDYQTRGDAMRQSITADDVLRELGGRG